MAFSNLRSYIKIVIKNAEDEIKSKKWDYGVLKSNMLFIFPDETSATCTNVVCLDGCEVLATQMKLTKKQPVWTAEKNAVILQNTQRDLLPGARIIFIYFKTRREFEHWYLAFTSASQISVKKVGLFSSICLNFSGNSWRYSTKRVFQKNDHTSQ